MSLPQTEPGHVNPADDPDVPGCEVIGFIGRGGMGAVYKARQQSLNRMVAVKLLSIQMQPEGLDFASRFRVEAQAMARLAHPNIVSVHDFGSTADGRFFYVMELVDGTDLSRRILDVGRLPPAEVLRIMLAVCAALECAHAQGVLHRDIKPSNILISQAGVVKVADFGLAKVDDPATASLTLSGTTMGSHGYAAPEVFLKAGTADHRADIYSLGVLLYQMLTGNLPRGMFKLPSERVPGLDARLDEVICKAMEEDREDRYQSIAEMRVPLEEVFASFTAPALPVTPVEVVKEGALARHEPGVVVRLSWKRVTLAAAAVLVLGTTLWYGNKPGTAETGLEESMREEGWQNLLAPLDLKKQSAIGHWIVENGVLTNRYDAGTAMLKLPVDTPMSYDLRVRTTPQRCTDGYLIFPLQHGAHAGTLVIDDSHAPVTGFESVGGKRKADLAETISRRTPFLPLGQTYELLFHVRNEGLLVLVNGEPLYRWKGDWAKASLEGPWLLGMHDRSPFLGLGCQSSKILVHSVEYHPVTGAAAQSLPDVAFDPASVASSTLPPSTPREFRGHRYRYVPGQFTWDEARVNAISLGGHLATLTDEAENQWVWSEFSKYLPSLPRTYCDDRAWWIGGAFSKESNSWSWVTGEPFQYTCWSALTPPVPRVPRLKQHDNGGGGGLPAWTQHHYSSTFGYLVEWDPPAPVPAGTLNLLAKVEIKRDAIRGHWDWRGSDLRLQRSQPPPGNGLTRLQLPYEPQGEYDFELEFTPVSGDQHVHQLLSMDGRAFSWVLNVPTSGGVRAGFESLYGKTLNYQTSSPVLRKSLLINGQRHRSKVEVRKKSVLGYLDGELLVSYGNSPDYSAALSLPPYLALRDERHLGIAAQDRELLIHRIEVREITSTEKSSSAPSSSLAEGKEVSDAEQREFAAWLFSQPRSTDALHVGANQMPDLMIAGSGRNLRKVAELPKEPFSITRVRIGPVRMDEAARRQLDVLSKLPDLDDLRIYGAESSSVLACLHHKSGLGTVIFRGPPGLAELSDKDLVHLARMTHLHTMRLECWRGLTGQGFAHIKDKRSLDSLGLLQCPDLNDTGLGEIARFTQLKTLSLSIGASVTDEGLAQLAKLANLEQLTLSFMPEAKATGSGLTALAGLTKLRTLDLDGSFPGSGFQFVGRLTSLKELQCSRNSTVTDAAIANLKPLVNLTELHLPALPLTDACIPALIELQGLTHLDISGTGITEKGLAAIQLALAKCAVTK